MKKLIRIGAFVFMSTVAVVAFQNCSQPGKLGMKSGVAGDSSGADLVVSQPMTTVATNNPTSSSSSSGSSSGGISSSGSSSGGTTSSGSSSSSSGEMTTSSSSSSGSSSGGTTTTTVSSSSSGSSSGSSSSSSSSSGGVEGDDNDFCGYQSSDFLFTFDHLTLQCEGKDAKMDIPLVAGQNVFSNNKNFIEFDMSATREVPCGQFFAYFKASGNALMKSDGETVAMSSSDKNQMPKGFVRFPVHTTFKAGKRYKLVLTFSPLKQDVSVQSKSGQADDHGQDCRFKPFFHADITEM